MSKEDTPVDGRLLEQRMEFTIDAPADFWCVTATCGRKATFARVMTATAGSTRISAMQPVCDSCAAWMESSGSKVIPLAEALAGARD